MHKIPDFTLKNQDGKAVNTQQIIGKPAVIYFYPKNDTPGCTAEACSFRDNFEAFVESGVQVFGISADSTESHKAFKAKYRLPFDLLSDKDGIVKKMFGVKGNLFGLISGRETFIFDAEGKLVHQFNSQFNATQHVKEALKALKIA